MQEHQRLQILAQALQEAVEALGREVANFENHLQTQRRDLQEVWDRQLQTLSENLTQQIKDLQTLIGTTKREHQELTTLVHTHQDQAKQALAEALHTLSAQIVTQDQMQSSRLEEKAAYFTNQLQIQQHTINTITATLGQIKEDLTRATQHQQEALHALRQEATAQNEKTTRDLSQRLATLTRSQVQDTAVLTQKLEEVTTRLGQLDTFLKALQAHQNQTKDHDQRLQELERKLAEEQVARHILTQRVQELLELTKTSDTPQRDDKHRKR
jgi:chromosome segregation ATPase